MLWAVEDEQGNQSWLLGTMHSEAAELLEIPPELRTVLESADTLALELVPDGIMLAELNQAMHLDGSERLGDSPSAGAVPSGSRFAGAPNMGFSENGIARMRPWAVAMTLSLPPPQTAVHGLESGRFGPVPWGSKCRRAGNAWTSSWISFRAWIPTCRSA